MISRPLHQLFDAMYHRKYRFEEFLALKPEEHYSPVGGTAEPSTSPPRS
jgi:RNA-directed DNA polymerase